MRNKPRILFKERIIIIDTKYIAHELSEAIKRILTGANIDDLKPKIKDIANQMKTYKKDICEESQKSNEPVSTGDLIKFIEKEINNQIEKELCEYFYSVRTERMQRLDEIKRHAHVSEWITAPENFKYSSDSNSLNIGGSNWNHNTTLTKDSVLWISNKIEGLSTASELFSMVNREAKRENALYNRWTGSLELDREVVVREESPPDYTAKYLKQLKRQLKYAKHPMETRQLNQKINEVAREIKRSSRYDRKLT